jgi:hypothetical protein
MKPGRWLLATELAAAGGILFALGGTGLPPLADWLAALPLLAALVLIEAYDVQLPRGERSTMSPPLIAVAVYVLHPSLVVPVVALSSAIALVASYRSVRLEGGMHIAVRRVIVGGLGLLYLGILLENPLGSAILGLGTLAAAVVILDFLLAQVQAAVRLDVQLLALILGSSRLQGAMLVAKVTAAVLALVLFDVMGSWVLIVLVLLLLVMRQSFLMLLNVRGAYQATIEAFAGTAEAVHPEREGHAMRVSRLATEVGREFGFRGSELERLAYSALLHDLGAVSSGREGEIDAPVHLTSSEMLKEVSFLQDVVPVLRVGEHGTAGIDTVDSRAVQMAYTVLLASRNDDLVHGFSTDADARVLQVLDGRLDSATKRQLDRAFRSAMSRIEGTAIAYAANGEGVDGDTP